MCAVDFLPVPPFHMIHIVDHIPNSSIFQVSPEDTNCLTSAERQIPADQTPVSAQTLVKVEEEPTNQIEQNPAVEIIVDKPIPQIVEESVEQVSKDKSKVCEEANEAEVEEQTGDIFIEVTTLPATRQTHHLSPKEAIQTLTPSETWHFQPQSENELLANDDIGQELEISKQQHLRHHHHYLHHQHDLEVQAEHKQWPKSIVKPENYCFHCLPDTMTTKVGRSAGRMPGGMQSPAGQVLRMARRQNEVYKKAPPVRTPPSIPSTQHMHNGLSTPRQGRQYSTELEHHARKVKSPRHFMEQGKIQIFILFHLAYIKYHMLSLKYQRL